MAREDSIFEEEDEEEDLGGGDEGDSGVNLGGNEFAPPREIDPAAAVSPHR